MRRLRRPGSRSSLSTERPSASRPTSDGARDSGGWRGTRRAREGTRAGAQPRARGRTRPEIVASAILNSPQSASRPEPPPPFDPGFVFALQGLRRLLQQVRYQGADLAIGPLWRLSPGALDITAWLDWFLGCLGRAIDGTDEALAAVLGKAVLWQHVNRHPVEERQRRVINRLLDGFEGFLTTSKYAAIAKCSADTALRDIGGLVSRGIAR